MAVTMNATLTQDSQNIEKNTSSVTLKVTVTTTYGSYNHNGTDGTVTFSGNFTGSYDFWATFDLTSTTTIYTKTITVPHNADGTAKVTAKVVFDTDVSSGVLTKTVTKTLTTIPRASTPSFTGSAIGSAVTIKTNRKSSGFTHDLTYSFEGATGTIAEDVGASATWTPPMSLCNRVTDATSAECIVTCETYSGSTLIGTKTAKLKLSVPASVVPTIGAITHADETGLWSTYGAYVQSLSSVKFTADAEGAYGSTIKTYSYEMDGQKSSGSSATSTAMQPLESGTRTLTVTVTDTRGRTAKKTMLFTVASYTYPTATVTAFRSTGGTEDDESTTIRVGVDGSTCDVNSKGLNTADVKIEFSQAGSNSWTVAQDQNRGLAFSFYADLTEKANTLSFDIRVTVTDQCGQKLETVKRVSTATPVLDFKKHGNGVAVLGVATREGLEIGCDTFISKPVKTIQSNGLASNLLTVGDDGRPTIENHIALDNGKYLQGVLSTGAKTNILRLTESDVVGLYWTMKGLGGDFYTLMFDGTWSEGGNIGISTQSRYNIFIMKPTGADTPIVAYRLFDRNVIRGFGMNTYKSWNGDFAFQRYGVNIKVNAPGGSWTLTKAHTFSDYYSSNNANKGTITIEKVWGVM